MTFYPRAVSVTETFATITKAQEQARKISTCLPTFHFPLHSTADVRLNICGKMFYDKQHVSTNRFSVESLFGSLRLDTQIN